MSRRAYSASGRRTSVKLQNSFDPVRRSGQEFRVCLTPVRRSSPLRKPDRVWHKRCVDARWQGRSGMASPSRRELQGDRGRRSLNQDTGYIGGQCTTVSASRRSTMPSQASASLSCSALDSGSAIRPNRARTYFWRDGGFAGPRSVSLCSALTPPAPRIGLNPGNRPNPTHRQPNH